MSERPDPANVIARGIRGTRLARTGAGASRDNAECDAAYARSVLTALRRAGFVVVPAELIVRALDICEDAAADQCDCDGYYQCNTCPSRIAERADDAADVLRAALNPNGDTQ